MEKQRTNDRPTWLLKRRLNFFKIKWAKMSWNALLTPRDHRYDNSCCSGNLMPAKGLNAGQWAISVTCLWIEHAPRVRLRTGVSQWIGATPREFSLEWNGVREPLWGTMVATSKLNFLQSHTIPPDQIAPLSGWYKNMSYNDDLEEWHGLAFHGDQKGLLCTKGSPCQSQEWGKETENKRERMETNSNSHGSSNNNNRKGSEWRSSAWFCCKMLWGTDKIALNLLWCQQIILVGSVRGALLSFCTGTEKIAGWEKVSRPNKPAPTLFFKLCLNLWEISIHRITIKLIKRK